MAEPSLPVGELEAAYDVGPWDVVRFLPGGKNQHFLLDTGRGRFVVRRSHRSKTTDGLRFEHELQAHLRAHGYPAPEAVTARSGDTWLGVGDRLYTVWVFVDGEPYRRGDPTHLQQAAEALATYHDVVRGFRPSVRVPLDDSLAASLCSRLTAVRTLARGWDGRAPLAGLLAFALEEGDSTTTALDELYPLLPRLVIHGGCRRGSMLFSGGRLAVVLDYDSAREEARALDLAIAVHDFSKVYGDARSAAYKVPLDPEVTSDFLATYQLTTPLEPAELEALPALLAAKRLKRALGRYERILQGSSMTPGDERKVALELARVRWLRTHGEELRAALTRPHAVQSGS